MKKETQEKQKNKKGFTLIEMLVVVLIIGILAAVALPQYKLAVTKSKVAAILPMMRHIKDSYMAWKLTNGSYMKLDDSMQATIFDLGIDCPDGWTCDEGNGEMENDYWYCFPNEEHSGMVYCTYNFRDITSNSNRFDINMYQPDDEEMYPDTKGMTTCYAYTPQSTKICQALGGKLLTGNSSHGEYAL